MKTIKLTPSSLSFSWEGCKSCFHAERRGWKGVPPNFPSIFREIDKAMRLAIQGRCLSEIHPGLPVGRIDSREYSLTSVPIVYPDLGVTLWIGGKTDMVIFFPDGTHGIADLKTSKPDADYVQWYRNQIDAYAYCMEHPGEKSPLMPNTNVRGLVISRPVSASLGIGDIDQMALKRYWLPFAPDRQRFVSLLREVATLLSQPEPPYKDKCQGCEYRRLQRYAHAI